MMYQNATGPPDHFGMQPGGGDDKRHVIPGSHHMGEDWNHMFPPGGNEQYMNPMFGGYDQSQNDVKKDYESHEAGSNGYYIPSTSLGADGTLGPPLWKLQPSLQDVFQTKVNALLTFVFPGGIQESLQEPQNKSLVRSCLTVDAVQHFLDLFSHFQGSFPWLHLPTFDLFNAYDGLVLVLICSGAVYSDRVSQTQVRALMQRVKYGIERTSRILQSLGTGPDHTSFSPAGVDFEELLALQILQSLLVWHGDPNERARARHESRRIRYLVRQLNMLTLAGPDDPVCHSYLHSLQPGEDADPSRWEWRSWVEQEKRSRLMFMVFLWDAAMCIYFNVAPHFSAAEIKLPLPCDDAAWEANDAETCAQALGLRGQADQAAVNTTGSLRLKQLELHHAMSALHSTSVQIQPRTTNVYSKFILIHAVLVEIWQHQRLNASTSSPKVALNRTSRSQLPKSIGNSLSRWKQSWDEDLAVQFPQLEQSPNTAAQIGFCRDGIQFYWLAHVNLRPERRNEWQLSADHRLRQTLHDLRSVRVWCQSDGGLGSEYTGSVTQVDDDHALDAAEIDMRKLFRPLHELSLSGL